MDTELQKKGIPGLAIGGIFGTKDKAIEETLNAWGEEGWEVTHVYTPENSGKVLLSPNAH